MDPSLVTLIPTGSIAGVLVMVIIYLLKQNHMDRKQYRDDVARIEDRASRDADARQDEYQSHMSDVRTELVALRLELKEVREELEAERNVRWKAQDDSAGYRRELDAIKGARLV